MNGRRLILIIEATSVARDEYREKNRENADRHARMNLIPWDKLEAFFNRHLG